MWNMTMQMSITERNAIILKLLRDRTKRNSVSKEAARASLIESGIYTEDGELSIHYGGPGSEGYKAA
jgi:hypothetical protein